MTSEDNPRAHLSREPCSRCNWSPDPNGYSRYKSNVNLVEAGPDGIWTLGDKYILKDRDKAYSSNDPDNHEFVRRNTSIPVPKILASWEQPGDRCMMIEEVIEDKHSTLRSLWPTLSESDRQDIAQQTADYLKQLRSLTSEKIQTIKGGPVYSYGIFRDHDPELPRSLHGPYESDEEVFEAMTAHLIKKGLREKVVATIREHLGPARPYTFTHTNLDWGSIVLKGKKVVGITDWEHAAYLPSWAEFIFAQWSNITAEKEWIDCLKAKLDPEDQYQDVENSIRLIFNLENYPKMNPETREDLDKVEAIADEEADQESTELVAEGIARVL